MAIKKVKLPDNSVVEIHDSRIPGVDSTPTSGSTNIVTSGGVYSELLSKVVSDDINEIVALTNAQYDALATKDNATLYILNDVGEAYIGSKQISGVGFESVSSPTPADGTATITLTNGDTITLDLNHSHPQYLKYVLCASEAEYEAITTKDSTTLYLIPETS